jgi:TorA maturation chaperone TorD
MNVNMDKWKINLLGETLLLGVLGKALQSNPDKQWLQSLIEQDIFSESPLESKCPELEAGLIHLQSWSRENQGGMSNEQFMQLQADYTRLFVGPGNIATPCWESVYFNEDRMVFQIQTLQVRQWYRRFGLEPEKLYNEPDDHIGLELSFLAYLAQLGLQALNENDEGRFKQILQAQRQFILEHPLKWVADWSALVNRHAKTDFYHGLALLAHGALLVMAEQLPSELSEEYQRESA